LYIRAEASIELEIPVVACVEVSEIPRLGGLPFHRDHAREVWCAWFETRLTTDTTADWTRNCTIADANDRD